MEEENFVSTREVGDRNSAGIGYVVCPNDIDIDSYESFCKKTNTISFVGEDGGIFLNIICPKHILEDIIFPSTIDSLGSQLVWINIPKKNQVIPIAIVGKKDEILFPDINKKSLGHLSKDVSSVVSVDKKTGDVYINSNSKKGSGNIYIVAKNGSNKSFIKIIAQEELSVVSNNLNSNLYNGFKIEISDPDVDNTKTTVSYQKGVGLFIEDEFGNKIETKKDEILFNGGENGGLVVASGTLSKINSLESKLNELIVACQSQVVTLAPSGAFPLAPFFSSITPLTPTQQSEIENEKIKH